MELGQLQVIEDHLQACAEEFMACEYSTDTIWKINGDEFELVLDEHGHYQVPLLFRRLGDDELIEVDVWVTVRNGRKRRRIETINTNGLI